MPSLGFAALVLVGCAIGAGLSGGRSLLVGLALLMAVAFGIGGGVVIHRLWIRSAPEPESGPAERVLGRLGGGPGFLVLFFALTVFTAAEGYAVGAGMTMGAPAASAALLPLPAILGGWALHAAARRARGGAEVGAERSGERNRAAGGTSAPGHSKEGTGGHEQSERRG